jgi:hypothetical protein
VQLLRTSQAVSRVPAFPASLNISNAVLVEWVIGLQEHSHDEAV